MIMKSSKKGPEIKFFTKVRLLERDPIPLIVGKFQEKISLINDTIHLVEDENFLDKKATRKKVKIEKVSNKKAKLPPLKLKTVFDKTRTNNSSLPAQPRDDTIESKDYDSQPTLGKIKNFKLISGSDIREKASERRVVRSVLDGLLSTTESTDNTSSVLITETVSPRKANIESLRKRTMTIIENDLPSRKNTNSPLRMSKQRSQMSLDLLTTFLESYRKSDEYLKEGQQVVEQNVSYIKNSYKKSDKDDLKAYKQELKSNLMPANEKRTLFYIKNREFQFYDKKDNHIMKSVQALDKVDILGAYKFRNVIKGKYLHDSESKAQHLAKRSEERFANNQTKVVRLLRDSNLLKNKVLSINI